jgi:hypothetical protein
MSDFFGALELELHAAANRRPRRQVTVGQGLGAVAAAALVAVAVGVVAAVSGGGSGDTAQVTGGSKPPPVGTVIPKGKGFPPRTKRSVVVATGTTRYAGPWQLEIQGSERLTWKGEVLQPAGLTCVYLYLLDPPGRARFAGGGYCGEQRRTPGFTRGQQNYELPQRSNREIEGPPQPPQPIRTRTKTKQVLIFGRTPERAEYVVITTKPSGLRMRSPVFDGPENMRSNYYVVAVPPHIGRSARINWLDEAGKPGSRGAELLPPVAGKVRR